MQLQKSQKDMLQKNNEYLSIAQIRQALTPQCNQDLSQIQSESQDEITKNKQIDIRINLSQNSELNKSQSFKNQQDNLKQKEQNQQNYKSFDHNVDHKYLVLLIVMNSNNLISIKQIAGLKQGYIDLYGKFSKVSIKSYNHEDAKAAIKKISEYIENLSVLKLNISGEAANRLQNFQKLKKQYRERKVIIFGYSLKNSRELHIGGQMKLSHLKQEIQNLKSLKINYFSLREIRNTKTYKIIFNTMLQMKSIQETLKKFNQIKLSEVQSFKKSYCLRILFATTSKKQYTPSQYQDFMMKEIKNYYVIIFLLNIYPLYFEKLNCGNIQFKYNRQIKLKRSSLVLLGHKHNFIENQKIIKQYLQKFNQNIIGLRFFDHLKPNFKNIKVNEKKYYLNYFPQKNSYSINIYRNKSNQQRFDWQEIYNQIFCNKEKNEES